MQRRLMLMRHAKSAWQSRVPTDHERPLNNRGRRDAPRVGKRLVELGWVPEHVVGSDSRRTQETWERMQKHFPEARVRFTRALYAGGPTELRTEVARLSAGVRTVLVLGHNPSWEEAVKALSGHDMRITTANVVLLEGKGATWGEAAARPVERRRRRPPEGALTRSAVLSAAAGRSWSLATAGRHSGS